MMKNWLLIFLYLISHDLDSKNHEPGWFFYHETIKSEKRKNNKKKDLTQKEAASKIKEIQEDLEEKRFLAILEPTQKNLESFLSTQEKSINLAKNFSTNWQKALAFNPHLDPRASKPISYAGNLIYKKDRDEQKNSLFLERLKQYELLFFYTENCPYCDLMFSTLSQVKGIKIKPVSMDNSDKYPESTPYFSLGIDVPITMTPYIWAFDKKKKNIKPICAGAKDLDDFKRIFLTITDKNGEF